jgi:hypothetical protein
VIESHGNFSLEASDRGERGLLHKANWEQAHYLYREGRISRHELRAWKLAHWCAMRFEGDAGRAQDRYATKCGMQALWNRRDKARILWARFCGVTL